MLGLGIIPFYYLIAGKTNHFFTSKTAGLLTMIFFISAVLSYFRQNKSLNFYSFSIDTNRQQNLKIIRHILKNHGWTIDKSDSNIIQAIGNGFRNNLDLRSWSELMTFEISDKKIKVNSICNPDGWIGQAFSFGKNRQNIRDFETLFLQESKSYYA